MHLQSTNVRGREAKPYRIGTSPRPVPSDVWEVAS
jgi:hypothetical protein